MYGRKVALVTGASRGIGREIAVTLGEQGMHIIVNYSSNAEEAEETLIAIENAGGTGEAYKCPVENYEAVKEMIDYIVKRHTTLDVLVNNAGITRDNLIMKMSEQEYDDVVNVNLKGAFNTIRHASRYFLKQKSGRIINITSVSGITGNAGQANYSAAKAGMIGLTKSVAKELASRGITVNAIAPGFVKTDMTEALGDVVNEKALEAIPLKRMGTPADIADMVLFLAMDQGNYITGQVFQVDGGLVI